LASARRGGQRSVSRRRRGYPPAVCIRKAKRLIHECG